MNGTWQQPTQASAYLPPSAPSYPTTSAFSISTQNQVLEDHNLLGEVLAFLPSVKDCGSALLVNRLWRTILEAADPWQHLLRVWYPGMHSLLRLSSLPVTAKQLLSIHLVCGNATTNEQRELRRLRQFFQHKAVNLAVRHPEHGCVATCLIPTHHEEGYKQFLERRHGLVLLQPLPVQEYERCIVVLQMQPVYLDFYTCSDYEVDEVGVDEDAEEEDEGVVRWSLLPSTLDCLDAKFKGFLHNNFETPHTPSFRLCFRCTYSADVDQRRMRAAVPEILESRLSFHLDDFQIRGCELGFLWLLESWHVAATHVRPDIDVEPTLRRFFQDTYMLILFGGVDRCLHGFALVPFCDEVGLVSLFQGHTTRLQLVVNSPRKRIA